MRVLDLKTPGDYEGEHMESKDTPVAGRRYRALVLRLDSGERVLCFVSMCLSGIEKAIEEAKSGGSRARVVLRSQGRVVRGQLAFTAIDWAVGRYGKGERPPQWNWERFS